MYHNLGYQFSNPELLITALTHRSYSAVRATAKVDLSATLNTPTKTLDFGVNNERLEFLGDAALGYVITEEIYNKFQQLSEHELTLMRANLVRGTSLSELARSVNLGGHIRLGQGERLSGGQTRDSILADAMEAVFGAILLDGGIEHLRKVVCFLFKERMDNMQEMPVQDCKTRLQEILQARALALPVYSIIEITGQAHQQIFTVECKVEELDLSVQFQASSRKAAEKLAAEGILTALEDGADV